MDPVANPVRIAAADEHRFADDDEMDDVSSVDLDNVVAVPPPEGDGQNQPAPVAQQGATP